MIQLKGAISQDKSYQGKLGGLTYAERAEIISELDKLLCETDPMWLERFEGWSIAAKIRFLQLCRGSILNSIENQDVPVPTNQPFRTIHTLIDKIVGDGVGPFATSVVFSKNGNVITETTTHEDGSTMVCTITLDDSGNLVSIVANGSTSQIGFAYKNGEVSEITVDGRTCSVEWEGF